MRTVHIFPKVQEESKCLYSACGSTSKYEVHFSGLLLTHDKTQMVAFLPFEEYWSVWHSLSWLPSYLSKEASFLWVFLFSSLAHPTADKNNIGLTSRAPDTYRVWLWNPESTGKQPLNQPSPGGNNSNSGYKSVIPFLPDSQTKNKNIKA